MPKLWRCRGARCGSARGRLVSVLVGVSIGYGVVEDCGWFVCCKCGLVWSATLRLYLERQPVRR